MNSRWRTICTRSLPPSGTTAAARARPRFLQHSSRTGQACLFPFPLSAIMSPFRDALQHRRAYSYDILFPKDCVLFLAKAPLQFLLEGSMPEVVEEREEHP